MAIRKVYVIKITRTGAAAAGASGWSSLTMFSLYVTRRETHDEGRRKSGGGGRTAAPWGPFRRERALDDLTVGGRQKLADIIRFSTMGALHSSRSHVALSSTWRDALHSKEEREAVRADDMMSWDHARRSMDQLLLFGSRSYSRRELSLSTISMCNISLLLSLSRSAFIAYTMDHQIRP